MSEMEEASQFRGDYQPTRKVSIVKIESYGMRWSFSPLALQPSFPPPIEYINDKLDIHNPDLLRVYCEAASYSFCVNGLAYKQQPFMYIATPIMKHRRCQFLHAIQPIFHENFKLIFMLFLVVIMDLQTSKIESVYHCYMSSQIQLIKHTQL